MKYVCSLLFLSFSFIIQAQTLQGYVHDEVDGNPLPGAFVYLDGTTYSATTDASGYFSITTPQKLNTKLVISYIGYMNIALHDPYQYTEAITILMRPQVTQLNEVVITKNKGPFSRKEMLEVFRDNFLGQSRAARSCRIANEDDIDLYFDTDNNILYAKAYKPLQIRNNYLKYNIVFDLTDFALQYTDKTLNPAYQKGAYFAGTTFFTDIADDASVYKKRKNAYLGSTQHLMKTMASGDWENQKFELFVNSLKARPEKYLSVTDTLGVKMVTILREVKEAKPLNINISGENVEELKRRQHNYERHGKIRFSILYDRNKQSYFEFTNGTFFIDSNGQYFPLSELRFGGYMAGLKAGDMLPANYK